MHENRAHPLFSRRNLNACGAVRLALQKVVLVLLRHVGDALEELLDLRMLPADKPVVNLLMKSQDG